ncbi:hypothetical protein [Phaeobacter inhibens]|uniref:hypothetical protein n=1 Tax=Phaeobacter inhibens TaxID=221822 RepID=UPI0021A60BB3|nr:hypothetical protein [Phaeobacter inhibens]UWR57786.1 hypothetical protein K4F89_04880 [Phaeobacter inhibens]UWR64682.1 hypothetical protein K4L02_00105 [Phaeobacter inhibens]UWR68626.1 hypothetical protein K4K95_00105 [Phaeobacter inhibens]UWS08133.1 hypothetical protein K4K98_00110 [Phaeobacter inhibens]
MKKEQAAPSQVRPVCLLRLKPLPLTAAIPGNAFLSSGVLQIAHNGELQQNLLPANAAAAQNSAKGEWCEIHSLKACAAGIPGMMTWWFIEQKQCLKSYLKLNNRACQHHSQETKMTKDLKNTVELFGFVATGLAVIGAMVVASLA